MKLLRFALRIALNLYTFFLIPELVFCQEKLTGRLTDVEDGKPISGAVVRIDSSFYVTTTDAEGKFSFSGPDGKQFHLTVSHLSYVTFHSTIEIGKEISFALSKRTYVSDEVNINATRAGINSSVAYSEIGKAEVEKYNVGKDIPALLNYLPSVVTTSDAGNGIGYSGIRIRGSDASRVNVTINGIPVNDAESHQVYWVDLPDLASSVENLQVQRGIGTSANGAGAFGGSINIQTQNVSVRPFATLNSSAGSFNSYKNTLSFGSGLLGKYFAVEGRLSQITSDGYIDRAKSNLRSFFASTGYYGSKNSLRAIVFSGKEKTYQSWYGVPEDLLKAHRTYNPAGEYYDSQGNVTYYNNQTDNYRQDNYQLLYSHEFNNSLNANLALHYTKGKGYYEEYKPGEDFSLYGLALAQNSDTAIHSSDLIRQLWLSNDFYGLTWSVNLEKRKWTVVAGGAANTYSGKHFGEVIFTGIPMQQNYPFQYYDDKATKDDGSVFIRTDYKAADALNLSLDLQERLVRYTFLGFSDNYLSRLQKVNLNFFNPKAGIHYKLSSETQFFASAGIGHKEPVRDDYVNSIPSNRPQPECMIDYESGIRVNSGKISFTLNGFYMDYKSQLILNGKINDVGEYIRESVKKSYREGVEFESKAKLSESVNLKTNLTLSKNRIKTYTEYVDDYDGGPQIVNTFRNTPIAFSPNVTGAVVLGVMPFKNFNIDLAGKYIDKQYLDNTGSDNRKLAAYFITDVYLSYDIHPKRMKVVSFHFSVFNVLNREYVSNGYSYSGYISGSRNDYNFYYPQAKINWMGGITVSL